MSPSRAPRLEGIVLCAGASRRLGTPKQALRLCGESLLHRALRLAGTAGVTRTHVVTGARARDDAIAVADTGANLLVNEDWSQGMAGSLGCGARAVLAGDADAALVLLVDQYRVDAADLERLVAAWREAPARPVAARYAGTRGVPVLLPRAPLAALLHSGLRGREWLARQPAAEVDMPHAAFDVDVPADVRAMHAYARGQA